jgi:hypothetical protein
VRFFFFILVVEFLSSFFSCGVVFFLVAVTFFRRFLVLYSNGFPTIVLMISSLFPGGMQVKTKIFRRALQTQCMCGVRIIKLTLLLWPSDPWPSSALRFAPCC